MNTDLPMTVAVFVGIALLLAAFVCRYLQSRLKSRMQLQIDTVRAELRRVITQIAAAEAAAAQAHADKRTAESELVAAKAFNRGIQVDAHTTTGRLHEAEVRIEQLQARDHFISTAGDRIAHDVNQRLQQLRDDHIKLTADPKLRAKVERDFGTVLEKIRLHLADDIKTHVEKCLKGDLGNFPYKTLYPADGARVQDLLEELATATKYEHIVIEPSDERMKGDWVHWDLLLSHIMSNAVEAAAPTHGLIRVVSRMNDGRLEIEFDNEGTPMNDETIAKVFDLGFSTKSGAGHGFGLFVAQQIAKGLGGLIQSPSNRLVSKGILKRRVNVVKFTVSGLPTSDITP